MMQADPLAGGECAHKLAIQPSRMLIINVLDDATFLELGQLQPAGESATFLPGPLAIDEQAEPLFETELAGIGRLDLFPEGVGHAVQLHQLQFFYGGLIQHRRLLKGFTAETHGVSAGLRRHHLSRFKRSQSPEKIREDTLQTQLA